MSAAAPGSGSTSSRRSEWPSPSEVTIPTLKVAQAPSHTLLCCVWRAARGRGTFIPGLCCPFAAHSVISAKNNLKRRQRRLLNTHAAALSLPGPVSRMLPKYSPVCLGHNQRLSAKEEIQEFLKRVGKFTAGGVRLTECDASVVISPETRGNGHCRGREGVFWASLALFWCFLAAFVAPSQFPSKNSWCISQPLVFSTFKNSCGTQVPAGPGPQCVYLGNVCKILVLVRAGEELIFTVDGMRLCFVFELKTGLIMATPLKPGC